MPLRAERAGCPSGTACPAMRGKNTSKTDPLPGVLLAVITPLWFFTMACTTQSPSPVPSSRFFVVKKGSKTRSRTPASIPIPVSVMESLQYGPSVRPGSGMFAEVKETEDRAMVITPPVPDIAWAALVARFMRIC